MKLVKEDYNVSDIWENFIDTVKDLGKEGINESSDLEGDFSSPAELAKHIIDYMEQGLKAGNTLHSVKGRIYNSWNKKGA